MIHKLGVYLRLVCANVASSSITDLSPSLLGPSSSSSLIIQVPHTFIRSVIFLHPLLKTHLCVYHFTYLKPPINFDSMQRDRCGTRFTTFPLLRFYAEGVPAVHSADQEALRRLHVRIKGRKLCVDFLINDTNDRQTLNHLPR